MPKDKQVERPPQLNRELWLEIRKKMRVYDVWKKGRATQEDYNDVVRLCRKKIRRGKATWFSAGFGTARLASGLNDLKSLF